MSGTRPYDLTREQVYHICESLKYYAEDLDHRSGSSAEVKTWAEKAALIWQIIDYFNVSASDGQPYVVPSESGQKKSMKAGSAKEPESPNQIAMFNNILRRVFLPVAFIFLVIVMQIATLNESLLLVAKTTVVGGVIIILFLSYFCRLLRKFAPKLAHLIGVVFYWGFIGLALASLCSGIITLTTQTIYRYDTNLSIYLQFLIFFPLIWYVIALGARGALSMHGA